MYTFQKFKRLAHQYLKKIVLYTHNRRIQKNFATILRVSFESI